MNKTEREPHWNDWDVDNSQRVRRGNEKLGRKYGFTPVKSAVDAIIACEEFSVRPKTRLGFIAATASQLNRLDGLTAENEHDAELKRDASAPYDPANGVNLALLKRANQIMSQGKYYVKLR